MQITEYDYLLANLNGNIPVPAITGRTLKRVRKRPPIRLYAKCQMRVCAHRSFRCWFIFMTENPNNQLKLLTINHFSKKRRRQRRDVVAAIADEKPTKHCCTTQRNSTDGFCCRTTSHVERRFGLGTFVALSFCHESIWKSTSENHANATGAIVRAPTHLMEKSSGFNWRWSFIEWIWAHLSITQSSSN